MSDQDIFRQVAKLHIASIDQGFLSTLGEGFLALMYQAIDECGAAVLFTEEDHGRVVGFVAGGKGMGPVCKQMLKHFPRLLVTLSPILMRPRKVWRIIELLRHSGDKETLAGLPGHELLSIAVLPSSRRNGVAQRLYFRLADHFHAVGATAFRIVVGEALGPAHDFYKRMGARPSLEISVHGREKSLVYVHDLN